MLYEVITALFVFEARFGKGPAGSDLAVADQMPGLDEPFHETVGVENVEVGSYNFV